MSQTPIRCYTPWLYRLDPSGPFHHRKVPVRLRKSATICQYAPPLRTIGSLYLIFLWHMSVFGFLRSRSSCTFWFWFCRGFCLPCGGRFLQIQSVNISLWSHRQMRTAFCAAGFEVAADLEDETVTSTGPPAGAFFLGGICVVVKCAAHKVL